jgi:hypothetical protein
MSKLSMDGESDSDEDHGIDLSSILSNYNSSLSFDATHSDTSNIIAGSKTEVLLTSVSPQLNPDSQVRMAHKGTILPLSPNPPPS